MFTGILPQGKSFQFKLDINGKKVEIRIKVGMIGDEIISVKPEYEDARKVSEESGISLKDVMNAANEAFMERSKYM